MKMKLLSVITFLVCFCFGIPEKVCSQDSAGYIVFQRSLVNKASLEKIAIGSEGEIYEEDEYVLVHTGKRIRLFSKETGKEKYACNVARPDRIILLKKYWLSTKGERLCLYNTSVEQPVFCSDLSANELSLNTAVFYITDRHLYIISAAGKICTLDLQSREISKVPVSGPEMKGNYSLCYDNKIYFIAQRADSSRLFTIDNKEQVSLLTSLSGKYEFVPSAAAGGWLFMKDATAIRGNKITSAFNIKESRVVEHVAAGTEIIRRNGIIEGFLSYEPSSGVVAFYEREGLSKRWEISIPVQGDVMKGCLSGNLLTLLIYSPASPGARLFVIDADSGEIKWQKVTGFEMLTERYKNVSRVYSDKDHVIVAAEESKISYLQVYDLLSGNKIKEEVIKK